jgi:hypothetical protein
MIATIILQIERRISAFTEQKRQEVDEYNRKEFCCVFNNDGIFLLPSLIPVCQ